VADKQTNKQTDTGTNRQPDPGTDRQTEGRTDRQAEVTKVHRWYFLRVFVDIASKKEIYNKKKETEEKVRKKGKGRRIHTADRPAGRPPWSVTAV